MLGKRSSQRSLFDAEYHFKHLVGEDSFHWQLGQARDRLFRDEDFAALYCLDNGRPSVPPSLLATALLLQAHDKVSDAEAHRRARLDLGWKVALGVEADAAPFAQSTLQHFRAQLILHDRIQAVFFCAAWRWPGNGGCCGNKHLRLVLDTTPILGRGAVKDTYNLLADGIRQLLRTMAKVQAGGCSGPGPSARATAAIWSPASRGAPRWTGATPEARRGFLAEIVADAERLLGQALTSPRATEREDPARPRIMAASELLCKLLLQDIERRPDGVALREGVAQDRSVSVHDPEMRHGRKSSQQRFDGHKAALAVEAGSQLITAVAVLPGNAPDALGALALVAESERHLEGPVAETVADAAYGDGDTRRQFAEADRTLIAKVPKPPRSPYFTKQDFHIDLEAGRCICPAGSGHDPSPQPGPRPRGVREAGPATGLCV